MRIKKNILVLFGGASSEHDISLLSVQNIIKHINREEYAIHLVGITKKGRWIYVSREEDLADGNWIYGNKNAYLIPDAEKHSLLILEDDFEQEVQTEFIDVCFPVLHGRMGEDGTVQGLLELADIPYVGCGVLASATAMDKLTTKILVEKLGIRQARYEFVLPKDLKNPHAVAERVEKNLGYPVFVKPANAGSSVGVSKANNEEEFFKALNVAAAEDKRILVEEAIVGREIECGVFSDGTTRPLALGEIQAANEFYDFEAKYHNADSKTVVDPELPAGVKERIFEAAVTIFDALDCYSLSRVDFFVEEGTDDIVFNEINTMPGFTGISMYPMMARFAGYSDRELIAALIETAFQRKEQ